MSSLLKINIILICISDSITIEIYEQFDIETDEEEINTIYYKMQEVIEENYKGVQIGYSDGEDGEIMSF